MWARVTEIMLGCWLLLSPFIFRHPQGAVVWWVNDLTCGTLVILLALFSFWKFSFWPRIRQAHLVILLVAGWMIGFAFVTASIPLQAALQNCVMVGLLLLMFALVPTEAELPPEKWQKFLSKEIQEQGNN